MTITINIETDNAAFSDGNRAREVRRIVREWINRGDVREESLRDYNGNTVGSVTVTGK